MSLLVQIILAVGGLSGLAAILKVLIDRNQVKEAATNLMVNSSQTVIESLNTSLAEKDAIIKALNSAAEQRDTENKELRELYHATLTEGYRTRTVVYHLVLWANNSYEILNDEQKLVVGKPPSLSELNENTDKK